MFSISIAKLKKVTLYKYTVIILAKLLFLPSVPVLPISTHVYKSVWYLHKSRKISICLKCSIWIWFWWDFLRAFSQLCFKSVLFDIDSKIDTLVELLVLSLLMMFLQYLWVYSVATEAVYWPHKEIDLAAIKTYFLLFSVFTEVQVHICFTLHVLWRLSGLSETWNSFINNNLKIFSW